MLYKSDPDPIWMGLSGFDEMHLVWKQACAGIIGPGFWQAKFSATSFPLSDTFAIVHRQLGSYCAKAARIRVSSG